MPGLFQSRRVALRFILFWGLPSLIVVGSILFARIASAHYDGAHNWVRLYRLWMEAPATVLQEQEFDLDILLDTAGYDSLNFVGVTVCYDSLRFRWLATYAGADVPPAFGPGRNLGGWVNPYPFSYVPGTFPEGAHNRAILNFVRGGFGGYDVLGHSSAMRVLRLRFKVVGRSGESGHFYFWQYKQWKPNLTTWYLHSIYPYMASPHCPRGCTIDGAGDTCICDHCIALGEADTIIDGATDVAPLYTWGAVKALYR